MSFCDSLSGLATGVLIHGDVFKFWFFFFLLSLFFFYLFTLRGFCELGGDDRLRVLVVDVFDEIHDKQ